MNAKGNKLSSSKIPDQYLKKGFELLEHWQLWLKKRKEKNVVIQH